jgi:hypothetical protein
MNARKIIWVTFQRAGFHRYPNAPEDVGYLAFEHRHLFKFKVGIEVFHDDREIEFHQFLRWLESTGSMANLDYRSCEMIADDLAREIQNRYPNRDLEIEVSEDGECGVTATYQK